MYSMALCSGWQRIHPGNGDKDGDADTHLSILTENPYSTIRDGEEKESARQERYFPLMAGPTRTPPDVSRGKRKQQLYASRQGDCRRRSVLRMKMNLCPYYTKDR
jgi:hypothetical protein